MAGGSSKIQSVVLLLLLFVSLALSCSSDSECAEHEICEDGACFSWLTRHTSDRAEVGLGTLVWNQDIALVAKKWADNCEWKHSSSNTQFRYKFNNLNGGENIAASYGNSKPGFVATKGWGDEKEEWDCQTQSCSGVCGHYTQMIWKDTTEIGCWINRACNPATSPWGNNKAWAFSVCQYWGPGNYNGQHPLGSSSSCPTGGCIQPDTSMCTSSDCGVLSDSNWCTTLDCGNTCPSTHSCENNQCTCTPLTCGTAGLQCTDGTEDDGCGGTYECSCPTGESCVDGQCTSEPGCDQTTTFCGTGPNCVSCNTGENCENGVCVDQGGDPCDHATNSCDGLECGTSPDGCADCGVCNIGENCVDGTCEAPPSGCPPCTQQQVCNTSTGQCECAPGYVYVGDSCYPGQADEWEENPTYLTGEWRREEASLYDPATGNTQVSQTYFFEGTGGVGAIEWVGSETVQSTTKTGFSATFMLQDGSTEFGVGFGGGSSGAHFYTYKPSTKKFYWTTRDTTGAIYNNWFWSWITDWGYPTDDFEWAVGEEHTLEAYAANGNKFYLKVDGEFFPVAAGMTVNGWALGRNLIYADGPIRFHGATLYTETTLRISITSCMSEAEFAQLVETYTGSSSITVERDPGESGNCGTKRSGEQAESTAFIVTLAGNQQISSSALASKLTARLSAGNSGPKTTSINNVQAEAPGETLTPEGAGGSSGGGGGSGGLGTGAIAGIAVGSVVGVAAIAAIVAVVVKKSSSDDSGKGGIIETQNTKVEFDGDEGDEGDNGDVEMEGGSKTVQGVDVLMPHPDHKKSITGRGQRGSKWIRRWAASISGKKGRKSAKVAPQN